ncbi:hypothetical protein CKO_01406 [Citrobacter koseri ATCC BAA-895]|uniref:Uncharacterized protein n=1 Tax=Citrobacter koseri (strain ATCC BAA-895 / CDC 4225-83 / SGSC4696) TaxID=290338 RepID=A8AGC9_CITK8|nr:hypothetical protein CKO_01406 [Citrobacter koseri ATCC BAA-895]
MVPTNDKNAAMAAFMNQTDLITDSTKPLFTPGMPRKSDFTDRNCLHSIHCPIEQQIFLIY